MFKISRRDVFGLIHPSIDAHTLGMLSFAQVMEDCGIETCIADETVGGDLQSLARNEGGRALRSWLANKKITVLGFSYRLDPDDAIKLFDTLHEFVQSREIIDSGEGGGEPRALFRGFARRLCDRASKVSRDRGRSSAAMRHPTRR